MSEQEEAAAVATAVMEYVHSGERDEKEEQEEIAAVIAAVEEAEAEGENATAKIRTKLSAQWAFPYFDFETFAKEQAGHIAKCRENAIPSHMCEDVAMYDEIAYATKIAEEYHDFFEAQPGYETYLEDLGEYYSISGDKEKQEELAKKFYKKYPSSLIEVFGEDRPVRVMNPFVAHYYRSQKGVSFSDPATFGSDLYGRRILQSNANLLKKVAHPELMNDTQIASAFLASLWACSDNPLGTDDPRCAFSTIYSELVDYYLSKDVQYKRRDVKDTQEDAIMGMPLRPRLRLRPPPPMPCDVHDDGAPTPSPPPVETPVVPVVPVPVPVVPVPAATPVAPVAPAPIVPVPVTVAPIVPAAAAKPSYNAMRREEARIVARIRYAPVLTKGFGSYGAGKYIVPSPGFGSGIVW